MTESLRFGAMVAAVTAACGSGGDRAPAGAGRAAIAALAAAVDTAATIADPWRCARARPATGPAIVVGGRTWQRDQAQLTSVADTLTIVAVADARGAVGARVRDQVRATHADLVITLGGMGTTAGELASTLGAIVDPAWLTIAVPGTTEAWPEHQAAVAALAAGGAAIVDGSEIRTIDAGAAVIATVPGLPYRERLAAGAEGCRHDPTDVISTVAALVRIAGDRPTVLVTAPAPQGGDGDLTLGGVHAGDPELATAATAVGLVIHAPIDGAPIVSGPGDGADHAAIAAGSLDAIPRFAEDGARVATSLTVVTFDRHGRAWRAVPIAPMVR